MTESGEQTRPDRDQYFMEIALAVRARAECTGRKVGAVLVREDRIIATGYNGTPENMPNCNATEQGCLRCSQSDKFKSGEGYDLCICVHAEQNALLSAARFGTGVEGATIYTTLRPCFGCTKEALQAHVSGIYYIDNWEHPDADTRAQYKTIQARFPNGVKQLPGLSTEPPGENPGDTGHQAEELTSG